MSKLNVLVLHRMGDPRYRREAVRALEYMIPECRTDINCIVHDADLAFPRYLKDVEYHLIVLGPTFLCNRYHSASFSRVLHNYDFIRESSACKVALPQDDYDCSQILDNWMTNWDVDRVYSVCSKDWEVLYPNYLRHGDIKLGYTGYVSDEWIKSWIAPKPHSERSIDISYRANFLPANFGSIGHLKGDIADRFVSSLPCNHNLKIDISVEPKDLIPGSNWHDFLEDSRFCLTTPSGSSLLDPMGHYRLSVNGYIAGHPNATFDEIKEACFPGEDRKYEFTAISPRNIEAALSETVQIATPGYYSDLIYPLKHYLPLEEDCSNISTVLQMMNNKSLIAQIKDNCKKAMLDEPRLRRRVIVDEILDFAEIVMSKRNIKMSEKTKTGKLFQRYYSEIDNLSKRYWLKRRLKSSIWDLTRKLRVIK